MTFPAPIPSDPSPAMPPDVFCEADTAAFSAEQDSLRRAMPIQRLLGSGMSHADAVVMHAAAQAKVHWDVCGEWLGERNLRLAHAATSAPSSRQWLRFAAACFRVAQSAIPVDTERKRTLLGKMIVSFGAAGELEDPAVEKHAIDWRNGQLCGWLMRPPGIASPPVVVVVGGFDGWREEYYPGARALVERGIAAFLVDGPGQGESRLFHRLFLDASFPDAFAAIATYVRERCGLGPKVGIWGNSLGGFLAAKAVATHPSLFDAVCVNGGTNRPLELPERFPRFFEKVEALVGSYERENVIAAMTRLELTDDDAGAIICPLLQLHSVPDQVFLLENARLIHDLCASTEKQILIWEDGDHCMYNHSDEKNAIVSDWFAERFA